MKKTDEQTDPQMDSETLSRRNFLDRTASAGSTAIITAAAVNHARAQATEKTKKEE